MANQSAKKIAEQNANRLKVLQFIISFSNVLHLLVRFYIRSASLWWFSYAAFAVTASCQVVCYGLLQLAAEVSHSTSGEIIDGGTDLSMAGVCEYYHDAIYISIIMQLLTIFSDRFWLLTLLVPVYLVYLFWTMVLAPWIFTPTEEEAEENERYRQRMARKGATRRRR